MRNRSIVWIPVLLVGAMVYWTLALGFGGLSLTALTTDFPLVDPDEHPRDAYQSITVNLAESPESEAADPQGPAPAAAAEALADPEGSPAPAAGEVGDQAGQGQGQGGPGLAGGSVLRTGPGDTAF